MNVSDPLGLELDSCNLCMRRETCTPSTPPCFGAYYLLGCVEDGFLDPTPILRTGEHTLRWTVEFSVGNCVETVFDTLWLPPLNLPSVSMSRCHELDCAIHYSAHGKHESETLLPSHQNHSCVDVLDIYLFIPVCIKHADFPPCWHLSKLCPCCCLYLLSLTGTMTYLDSP